jgi:DHA3 family tetracycline resistance protein-like MFS transporter
LSVSISAYRVYLALSFGRRLAFYTYATTSLVYQVSVVGLNPLQLVLVGTVLEVSYFLLELPTGIVADVYSRRRSILIGLILTGLGFILAGAIPRFDALLLAQVIWGGGETFLSGATEAWIADELAHHQAPAQHRHTAAKTAPPPPADQVLGHVYLRGTQAAQAGALLGTGLSVCLASFSIPIPLVVGGALYLVLALGLAWAMPEQGFHGAAPEERGSWQALFHTARQGLQLVRRNSGLQSILVISIFLGAWSEGFDRLWTKHLLDHFTLPPLGSLQPVVWFGIIGAVSMILTLGLSELARRRVDTQSRQAIVQTLFVFNVLLMGSVIVFALAATFTLALIALWVATALRATCTPLHATWINQHTPSNVRATILSIAGQADSLGQIAGGPAVGLIGTLYTLRAALLTSGLILLPASFLYGRAQDHQTDTNESS